MSHLHPLNLFVITCLGIGGYLLAFPVTELAEHTRQAAGLVMICISLLASSKLPEYLTALLFFTLAMLFSIAPASVVFSGFASTALWLVFSGLVIGIAMDVTGLGKRIAGSLAAHLEGSYVRLIAGMVVVSASFAFIMPSAMGRVVLLVPIAVVLAEHFSFAKGSQGRTGLVLAATLGTLLPAFSILPANVVNMVLVGMSESQLGFTPLFGEYLLLHFPVFGLLKAVLLIVLLIRLFPDQPLLNPEVETYHRTPMSRQETLFALVLACLLVLWLTDFWHHISPAWIGLAGAVVLLLPKVGIIGPAEFNRINYAPLLFVAAVIGLGNLIHHSALGSWLGGYLLAQLPLAADASFSNYFLISLMSTLVSIVTTLPGIPAVMTPLAPEIADLTQLSLKSIVMMQVVGFSLVLFPYQVPPIMVGLNLSQQPVRSAFKPLLLLSLISILLLLPLNYVWWVFLGWL